MCRLPCALRVFVKLTDEGNSENFGVIRSALSATYVDTEVFLSAIEHDVMLCINIATAHTRGRTQNSISNGRDLYSYAALILSELRRVHRTACEKHSLSVNAFLRTAASQTRTFSLPVIDIYLDRVNLFS